MSFTKIFFIGAIFFTMSLNSAEKDPKIVIIGAGIAGLTTAYRLDQQGADVHLYEARNRIGGRIFSATIAGNIAELGGQHIGDGGEAKNMLELIKEFDLELVENRIVLNHSLFNGEEFISQKEMMNGKIFDPEKLKNQIDDLVKKSKNMKEVLQGLLDEEDPLYKTVSVRLAAYEGGTVEKLSPSAKTLYYMLQGGIASFHQTYGAERQYLNLLSLKDGNAILPEKMAKALNGRLHLNKILKSVAKDAEGYVLVFQDGQKIKTDILVLALPCTVYADVAFGENVIPIEKLQAIKNVQYGTNAKILIPFTKSPHDTCTIVNDHAVSFYNADRHHLTLNCVGDAGRFDHATILDAYNRDKPWIEMRFGGLFSISKTPVYAKDESFAVYDGPVGFSWPNDPFAKGSYSYIAQGQETVLTATNEAMGETVKTLFAPIDQTLFFAGEHTTILEEIPGTMEAACESGERTARMILKKTYRVQ